MRRQWTSFPLIALPLLVGCGPAFKTQSLPLEEATPLRGSPTETAVTPPHDAHATTPATPGQPLLRFERVSTTPPFVYRVIESPPSDKPLFALTVQSCGKITHQPALGNTRLLFSGLGKVQLTPGSDISIGSERFPLQMAEAQLEGEHIFIRVLSVSSADCLTDVIVWSSGDVRLTERAIPIIEKLLIMHRHQVVPSLTDNNHPPA